MEQAVRHRRGLLGTRRAFSGHGRRERPTVQPQRLCADVAYERYGSSSSVELDMSKYDAEVTRVICCICSRPLLHFTA